MLGAVAPLRINHASADPEFRDHPAHQLYGIESFIGVPLKRRDNTLLGTLCALDTQPADLSDEDFAVFQLLAQLIAFELEADEQRQQREANVRALEDFISIAAHDLRQPLTTIQGRVQLLARQVRRNTPIETLAASIDTLLAQTQRAVLLSDTLLDVAHLEAGTLPLDRAPCDLVVLADQVMNDAQTVANDHTFVLQAPPTLFLDVDERRLGRVLRNLLDNAAKYAPAAAGPIVTRIDDSEEALIKISVRDSGPGVAEHELPLLFERQYRTAKAHSTPGSGLGLYIAQQIVTAHGGTIRAEHAPGGGLQVTIHLPRTI